MLRNHFRWSIANLHHKDKEHLALRDNFRMTKKFLITKFDCIKLLPVIQRISNKSPVFLTPACLFVWSENQHCFSTLNLIAYSNPKEEDAAEPANGSYRSISRKTTPDSTYGSVSSTSASGRTSPSNMSVISSTLSNFSLPFNSYSSTKSKRSTNNGSTVDETPPTIVRLNFSVEKRDQDKLFLRTNLTVIFWILNM